MEYQLGLWETLETMLVVRGSVLGTVIFLVIYIVFPIIVCWKIRHMMFRIIIIVTYIFVWSSFFFTVGNGWCINNEFLEIQTYGYADKIKISSMEIGMITKDSEWGTEYREDGANSPGLAKGKFRLKNKKKALVFNHFYQTKRLLIAAEGKYYLIGHPGIEKLYDLLIANGAKEKSFE